MNGTERFASLAGDFCRWVEAAPGTGEFELARARAFAARLYAAALDLAAGTADDQPAPALAGGLDYQDAFRRFAVLPIQAYGCADPLVVPPSSALLADVADDLADTYIDVRRGLALYLDGRVAAATWEWAFGFRTHWGTHTASALVALHAASTRCSGQR